ncbi:MAG: hypothetical protein PUP91_13540 [Rhizonema sp. PD37]|nr:hypothetical protein [Rhizonema sp. PD37]
MREELSRFGFESPVIFRDSILKGIEETADDVSSWLPEWNSLHELLSIIC